ncbi:GDSL esterase/lipase [Platanthera zijinensis]|uniref:GDSL esterase/lipase n=1 Tax=Platanthera zijinensis TaxID=2320716 RepID=A0AAP0FSB4_9ASPA
MEKPATTSIPAIIVFGDSTVDTGNNNFVKTALRSNFKPYGRDFIAGKPTGRFCNGRLATDFMAEALGLGEERLLARVEQHDRERRRRSPEAGLPPRGSSGTELPKEGFVDVVERGFGRNGGLEWDIDAKTSRVARSCQRRPGAGSSEVVGAGGGSGEPRNGKSESCRAELEKNDKDNNLVAFFFFPGYPFDR